VRRLAADGATVVFSYLRSGWVTAQNILATGGVLA